MEKESICDLLEMREEERTLLESELLSLRHHLREAEAAIAVKICTNLNSYTSTYTNTVYYNYFANFANAGATA